MISINPSPLWSSSRRSLPVWALLVSAFLSRGSVHAFSGFHAVSKSHLPPLLATRDVETSSSTRIARTITNSKDDPLEALWEGVEAVVQPLSLLIPVSFSLLLAVALIGWEDYGACNLWPSRHMLVITTSNNNNNNPVSNDENHYFGRRTVHGMAFGEIERLRILEQQDNERSSLVPEIRAYNEVMLEHRQERVPRWKKQQLDSSKIMARSSQQAVEAAVTDMQGILLQVLQLKTMANDYQWEQMHVTIQHSMTPKLEPSAAVLRRSILGAAPPNSLNNVDDIGFDWGSCAWRHCGALADAQEALDELDHLLGVLEPPECLFCLDVLERSIRDMLTLVPHGMDGMPVYQPYQSLHAGSEDDETDVFDQEYMKMLEQLRGSSSQNDDGGE
ncbi:expressed unknown protein [Seminavis robusta]|uniref:Transmembrane protein n=1 Tax=Seminavis robusta TaxID=568900 RepID=A0A9N8HEA3_9STRA|nr:expressed unknown protein [Seminavis robusta]|eukprot:Sro295_g110420.1 n/a (389) ;mRNA; f:25673-26839